MRRFFFGLVLALGLVAAVPAAPAQYLQARVANISDGDSLWIKTVAGERLKIRISQIDAPEICQAWGQESKRALVRRLKGKQLQVELLHKDRYERWLARIRVGGDDVGADMVASGHAWAYSLGKYRNAVYYSQEESAKAAKSGLWSLPSPVQPRAFRRERGSCYPGWAPKAQPTLRPKAIH